LYDQLGDIVIGIDPANDDGAITDIN
jgi:hypothetical protein